MAWMGFINSIYSLRAADIRPSLCNSRKVETTRPSRVWTGESVHEAVSAELRASDGDVRVPSQAEED